MYLFLSYPNHELVMFAALSHSCGTLNPKPQTLNPKPDECCPSGHDSSLTASWALGPALPGGRWEAWGFKALGYDIRPCPARLQRPGRKKGLGFRVARVWVQKGWQIVTELGQVESALDLAPVGIGSPSHRSK